MSPQLSTPDPETNRRRLDQLEQDLQRAERHHREDEKREHPFGENPDGLGPTLGSDLGKPNPGHDLPDTDED